MYLYVEVDSIDFLDKTLTFLLQTTCISEYWRSPSTRVTVGRGLEHHQSPCHHHQMLSTIFHQSTTYKTLTTKSRIDMFYMFFQWGLSASNSFWTHDVEILIIPTESKMEFPCILASSFHDRFLSSLHRVNVGISTFKRILRANENQAWLFSRI